MVKVLLIVFGIIWGAVFIVIFWRKVAQVVIKIVGTKYERDTKKMQPIVDLINNLEPEISKLTDEQLRAKTDEFRERVRKRVEEYEEQVKDIKLVIEESSSEERVKLKNRLKEIRNFIFEDILPEAFAVVREASKRTTGMRHFDVQLMGGIVLHQGKIAEMATGEGKTLVATLPLYLNALLGKGCHLVTVNDYLAKRDRFWMGPIYELLGLSVGFIQHDMPPEQRREAYACDIAYGTNNEFGFDYLRDNMVGRKKDRVQRPFYYAIVDEVDSILIDEARTPLIISGPAEESTDLYYQIDHLIPYLKRGEKAEKAEIQKGFDFVVEEKEHAVVLTDEGMQKCERLLKIESLYDNPRVASHINQALRAHNLFHKDEDYVVKEGKVIIVDEFTGRLMPGRRWSDGLHQAVEAKEHVRIERENQTLATVTFQNYFRLYEKLAGMTGTAETEAAEFKKIYNLDVVVLPTNCPLVRNNYPDVIYKTEKEKFRAVVQGIEELHKKGQPVLVGTRSIEKNEKLGSMLKARNIPHNLLNAKYHEMEASIIAQAGRKSAVTIATNMAGRGTDILLGGNAEFMAKDLLHQRGIEPNIPGYKEELEKLLPKFREIVESEHKEVVELGGLHIIGTERHEARRIDNQLRGRSGRQGDPGSSMFYLALEDELMRLFGGARIAVLMDRLKIPEDEPITHPWITRAVESAQKKVEGHNFDIRKQLLGYDDVMNKQREVIYSERNAILEGESLKENTMEMVEDIISSFIDIYAPKDAHPQDWDISGLDIRLKQLFGISVVAELALHINNITPSLLKEKLLEMAKLIYNERESKFGSDNLRELERMIMLQVVDVSWKDHLYSMDHLREGIGLRGYAERDPLVEYKKEGYGYFMNMIEHIKEETLQYLFRFQIRPTPGGSSGTTPMVTSGRPDSAGGAVRSRDVPIFTGASRGTVPDSAGPPHKQLKVGRNDPCPCGSGKKFKHCCGRVQ